MIPAFAFASSMRAPEFAQAMNAILRTVALLTAGQAKLQLVEETIDGVKLVGYRFPEKGSLPNDPQNLRFTFSPCFAAVDDQFFVASTLELGREMIGLFRKSPTFGRAADDADNSDTSLCGRRRGSRPTL